MDLYLMVFGSIEYFQNLFDSILDKRTIPIAQKLQTAQLSQLQVLQKCFKCTIREFKEKLFLEV